MAKNSKDSAGRASAMLEAVFGKQQTRRHASKRDDSPEARELRIAQYAEIHALRESGDFVGPNGRPVNLFTLEEYAADEVNGVEIYEDD